MTEAMLASASYISEPFTVVLEDGRLFFRGYELTPSTKGHELIFATASWGVSYEYRNTRKAGNHLLLWDTKARAARQEALERQKLDAAVEVPAVKPERIFRLNQQSTSYHISHKGIKPNLNLSAETDPLVLAVRQRGFSRDILRRLDRSGDFGVVWSKPVKLEGAPVGASLRCFVTDGTIVPSDKPASSQVLTGVVRGGGHVIAYNDTLTGNGKVRRDIRQIFVRPTVDVAVVQDDLDRLLTDPTIVAETSDLCVALAEAGM